MKHHIVTLTLASSITAHKAILCISPTAFNFVTDFTLCAVNDSQSVQDITVSVKDAAFDSNSAIDSTPGSEPSGGAIEVWRRGSTLNLLGNVNFTGNTAQSAGGAVFLRSGALLNVSQATFTSNRAEDGGAVFVRVS